MKTKLPYLSYPGCIPRILNKIKEAQTPERFTYDFLETKLVPFLLNKCHFC